MTLRRRFAGLLLAVMTGGQAAQLYAVCVCPPFCPYDNVGAYVRQKLILDGVMCWYSDGDLYTELGC